MRGLAVWAPTQTISLFWKCSLKSSGADRSQEQRGKWALTSFLLSLRASPSRSLSQTDIQLACRQYLSRAEVRRNRDLDTRKVLTGTDWQPTAGLSCLSSPSPSLSFIFHTHACVVNRTRAPNQTSAQVVSVGSLRSAEQDAEQSNHTGRIHCEVGLDHSHPHSAIISYSGK